MFTDSNCEESVQFYGLRLQICNWLGGQAARLYTERVVGWHLCWYSPRCAQDLTGAELSQIWSQPSCHHPDSYSDKSARSTWHLNALAVNSELSPLEENSELSPLVETTATARLQGCKHVHAECLLSLPCILCEWNLQLLTDPSAYVVNGGAIDSRWSTIYEILIQRNIHISLWLLLSCWRQWQHVKKAVVNDSKLNHN